MLKELGNEIIELFKAEEVKDTQIAELKKENESLKVSVEPLNTQISELQTELNVKINEIASKDSLLTEKENIISILEFLFCINSIQLPTLQ